MRETEFAVSNKYNRQCYVIALPSESEDYIQVKLIVDDEILISCRTSL